MREKNELAQAFAEKAFGTPKKFSGDVFQTNFLKNSVFRGDQGHATDTSDEEEDEHEHEEQEEEAVAEDALPNQHRAELQALAAALSQEQAGEAGAEQEERELASLPLEAAVLQGCRAADFSWAYSKKRKIERNEI